MQTPPWQVSPAAQPVAATHPVQPVVCARHSSTPLPAHRFEPTLQEPAHALHAPPLQNELPAAQV
jgi:hypothetical protein